MENKPINNVRTDIYFGSGAGTEIREKIKAARKGILVVSPFLAKSRQPQQGEAALCILLAQKAEAGIPVMLVTTEAAFQPSYDNPIYSLINQDPVNDPAAIEKKAKLKLHARIWMTINIILILLCVTAFFLGNQPLMSIISVGFIILSFLLNQIPYRRSKMIQTFHYKYQPKGNMRIKILKNYDHMRRRENGHIQTLHSKIYCIDSEVAYIGSMNFTEAGFKYNFESRVKIKDANIVADIESYWQKFFNDNNIPEIPWGPLAASCFEIPINWQKLPQYRIQ